MVDKLTAKIHGRKMVYVYRPDAALQGLPYERMTMAEARRRGLDDMVIMCAACDSPAVDIDSRFPYHQGWNRCKRCVGVPFGERRKTDEG